MSLCNKQEAMIRVRGATPKSPVVVLLTNQRGILEVCFAGTVYGYNLLQASRRNPMLIGNFNNAMSAGDVAAKIDAAMKSHMGA